MPDSLVFWGALGILGAAALAYGIPLLGCWIYDLSERLAQDARPPRPEPKRRKAQPPRKDLSSGPAAPDWRERYGIPSDN